jgi:hypothetical protein
MNKKTHPREQNGPAKNQLVEYRPIQLPERWDHGSAMPHYVTTLPTDTLDGRRQLYRALHECEHEAKALVGKELTVVGITFHGQNGELEDPSEVRKTVVKLSLADGTSVGTNSSTVASTLISLLDLYRRPPTADHPWHLEIYLKPIGPGPDGQPRSVVKIRDLDLARK